MSNILFPIGRMVWGRVDESVVVKDDKTKQPKLDKHGEIMRTFAFGVAVPKAGEVDWKVTEWGKQIVAIANAEFPQGQSKLPTFAWKVVDGDSTIPNKAGRIPSQQEGYAGCWIVTFKDGFAPKLVNRDGTAPIIDRSEVKTGHYVQVLASVNGNKSQQSPGVYINPKIVAHSAIGQEIVREDFDASSVGFGAGAMPEQFAPMTVTPPPAPVAAPPAPPSGPVMTAKATAPYETYIGAGWTDQQLRDQGYMI